jgi:arylsulfatase A-like enzyme
MCSPTRAALMTGRNHNRVGAGQIAEFANDWDGYTGVIPKSSATIAEVLGYYGYATCRLRQGPQHAGRADRQRPLRPHADGPRLRLLLRLHRRRDLPVGAHPVGEHHPISMPHVENYEDFHLTEAMADKAITWMRRHLAMNPDRPS